MTRKKIFTAEELKIRRKKQNKKRFKERYHTDPEFRHKVINTASKWQRKTNYFMNRYHNDPDFKQKVINCCMRYSIKRMKEDPEFRKKQKKYIIKSVRKVRFKNKFMSKGINIEVINNAANTIDFGKASYKLNKINDINHIPVKFKKK